VLSEQHRHERRHFRSPFARSAPEPIDDAPDVLERLLEGERAEAVRGDLDQLPAKDRELLELRIVGGLDASIARPSTSPRPTAPRSIGRLCTARRYTERPSASKVIASPQ